MELCRVFISLPGQAKKDMKILVLPQKTESGLAQFYSAVVEQYPDFVDGVDQNYKVHFRTSGVRVFQSSHLQNNDELVICPHNQKYISKLLSHEQSSYSVLR